ncbi:phosphatase PAP2 family protein, partial [bacterium]|nr:phosphatase PAP2 family protein [bacterium]
MTNILCVVALFFTSYVHFFTNFDIQLQHIFYNDGVWLIDPKEPVFYFLFYILPKVVVILLGSTSLVLLLRDYFSPKMNILGRVGL